MRAEKREGEKCVCFLLIFGSPDDVVNPTVYGGAGFCDQVSKRSEVEVQEGEAGKQHNRWKQISRGGGAVHVVATYLKTNSRVSADGIIGGGGGSVWVDSGYLVASASASFTASGSGATSRMFRRSRREI